VKTTHLWQGIGSEAWDYVPERNSWKWEGTTLSELRLVERWRERAKREELVVQPRLENHPSIARFSARGLCTLRIVTYFTAKMGRPDCLFSCWRMPVGEAHVDNFAAGGIAAAVSESGHLSPAVGKNVSIGTFTHHPTTDARIAGERLPHWREMVELALTAHEKVREPYFVGWDIALVDEGPLLLESNTNWGVDLAQMPHNRPLGETKFAEFFDRAVATLSSS
jgi:hypothetical protein